MSFHTVAANRLSFVSLGQLRYKPVISGTFFSKLRSSVLAG
jgi:hypothetical protein